MSIHVALNHVTHYRYDRLVSLSPQVVRLRPAPHSRTRILSYSLRVEPAEHFINWQQDPQSNYLARLAFPGLTRELRLEVDLVAEMAVLNPFDFFLEHAEEIPFEYEPGERHELAPFFVKASTSKGFASYLSAIPRVRRRTIDFLVELNRKRRRGRPLSHPPRAWRADAGGDAREGVGLVPRLGVAARAAAPPSRPRGALRLGLPDPARCRT